MEAMEAVYSIRNTSLMDKNEIMKVLKCWNDSVESIIYKNIIYDRPSIIEMLNLQLFCLEKNSLGCVESFKFYGYTLLIGIGIDVMIWWCDDWVVEYVGLDNGYIIVQKLTINNI